MKQVAFIWVADFIEATTRDHGMVLAQLREATRKMFIHHHPLSTFDTVNFQLTFRKTNASVWQIQTISTMKELHHLTLEFLKFFSCFALLYTFLQLL